MRTKYFPSRLHALDALRGLAALAVVFWHWQHFFYDGDALGPFSRDRQPYYALLSVFYNYGYYAVYLFFALSGFIFFWLYSYEIIKNRITGWNFFVLRFSRLYPLHLASFLLVALMQGISHHKIGGYLVYPENDLFHALLNIVMVPAWGFERGWSFNAPIWSVSIEVLLYGLFFFSLRFVRRPFLLCILFTVVGISGFANSKISVGLNAFFAGGLVYILIGSLIRTIGDRLTTCLLLTVFLSCALYQVQFGLSSVLMNTLLFPSLIGFLAMLQRYWPALLRRSAILGEISYSTYLLHFPLQLVFLLASFRLGTGKDIFYSPNVMLLYGVILVIGSFCSYRLFEAPTQQFLRKHLIKRA